MGCDLSKRIYGAALAVTPGLSLIAAETLLPMVAAAMLADANGLDGVAIEKLSSSFPGQAALREILISSAVDCLVDLSDELQKVDHVFLSCDKGNKKGLSHFVKILSWWMQT